MPKLPGPPSPAALSEVAPDEHVLAAGASIWRVYFRAGAHPCRWAQLRGFGPAAGRRFDHHDPPPRVQEKGILYGAVGPHAIRTCIAEVFQDTRAVDREHNEPWLVGFAVRRDLRLLDLTGSWPTRAGASQAIASGPRPRARAWSRAIHVAYGGLDGLLYRSSMNAEPALALYERARDALPAAPEFNRALADRSVLPILRRVCRPIGYDLLWRPRRPPSATG